MKTHHISDPSLFGDQIFDIQFQDETIQFDSWNLRFDDEDDESRGTDRQDDTDRDDGDPNRYLG